MCRRNAINKIREILSSEDISAIIIPSNDPHFGEYIPKRFKVREWISGFTGSAGTLVISSSKAALWTDSRYFIQGETQLEGSGIELMKMGMPETPTMIQWLRDNLEEDAIVAMDENLFSYAEYQQMVDDLSPLTATLIDDIMDEVWEDRPELEFNPIRLMPEDVAGESVESKHKRLISAFNISLPIAYIVTALDEVAWLTNLRGGDIEYNPLFLSYAVVTKDEVHLFVRQEMLSVEAVNYLPESGVELRNYEDFTAFLTHLPKNAIRIFSGNKITAKNYFAALENINPNPYFSPIAQDAPNGGVLSSMKSVKNRVEQEGFRKAYIEDAKAWKKIIAYIEANKDKGITEWDVAEKFIEFKKECPDYMGESFAPIVGYNANGALPHYNLSKETAALIQPSGFLLIDTGGQYKYGTTDMTRTLWLGELTPEQKADFTRVLKGMIALSTAKFVQGMRGCLLDILARGPVMNSGKMYRHGTCHGIGHNLCVHEGPQSVRMEENPVVLTEGQVMSNEPAVYIAGEYGIRHENTLIVQPSVSNEYGDFLEFETISFVPFDVRGINYDMLTTEEKKWLANYIDKIAELVGK